MTAAVEVRDLSYSYPDGRVALTGLNLTVAAGTTFGLLGANGAGKTTFLLLVAGLLRGQGEIKVFGEQWGDGRTMALRRRVALVFQDPDDMLFMPKLAADVAFGPRNLGLGEDEVRRRVQEALAVVGLAGYEGRAPHHLSLGERRRASLAAALAMEPELLLLDEPTANLDGRGRRELADVVGGLPGTKIIASHDLAFVGRLCAEVAVMAAGRVVASGPAGTLLTDEPRLRAWGLA